MCSTHVLYSNHLYFNPIIGLILFRLCRCVLFHILYFNPIIGLILFCHACIIRSRYNSFQSHYRSDFIMLQLLNEPLTSIFQSHYRSDFIMFFNNPIGLIFYFNPIIGLILFINRIFQLSISYISIPL